MDLSLSETRQPGSPAARGIAALPPLATEPVEEGGVVVGAGPRIVLGVLVNGEFGMPASAVHRRHHRL